MTTLFAETALTPAGWAQNLRIEIDARGDIAACEPGGSATGAERLAGPVIPGMSNLHSHAFQRAMAGLTERASGTGDSFWTWRDTMYRFVERITPEELRAIAAQLYVEMLKAGYTGVAEFHYLHHQPDGTPYQDPALLSEMVLEAAEEAGIGITLLPVLYEAGGFGGAPAGAAQRRFLNRPEALLKTIETLRRRHGASPQRRIGLAPHSLRAVPPASLAAALDGMRALDPEAPIHIHIAEQRREVEECLAWSGERPVAWLQARHPVGPSWCLVHATHMTEAETRELAASGAVAGLCPSTEGNLGDGFFPFVDFTASGGTWGIGSDSHISISAGEELRWLEYGQRLLRERRNLASAGSGSTGAALWRGALAGGARALGRPVGAIAPGYRADLLVLDRDAPSLYGRDGDLLLDSLVFAAIAHSSVGAIRDVMVGGSWVAEQGRHQREAEIARQFRRALDRLLQ